MASSLVAICLIVNSSRGGHHFVFNYPQHPRTQKKRVRKLKYDEDGSNSSSSDEDFKTNLMEIRKELIPHMRSTQKFNNNEDIDLPNPNISPLLRRRAATNDSDQTEPEWETLFGFHTSLLADILTPRTALCNQYFELDVDNLTFIGYPVCAERGRWRKKHNVNGRKRKRPNSKKVSNGEPIGLGIGVDSEKDGIPKSLEQTEQGSSDDEFHHDSGDGDNADSEASDELCEEKSRKSPKKDKSKIQITMFHVVFILDTPENDGISRVRNIYKNIGTRLASALKREQKDNDYVGREAEHLLLLKDRATSTQMSYNGLMRSQLEESDLARVLTYIYTALSQEQIAYVVINKRVELSLQLPPSAANILHIPIDGKADEIIAAMEEKMSLKSLPILEPFHTLLLPQDLQEIFKDMPVDAESTLIKMCQLLEPTISLAQLPPMLGCTLEDVYSMASHLLYWRKAKLINVVGIKNFYVVNPGFDFSNIQELNSNFAEAFPTLPSLITLLASLSQPLTFASLCPSKDHRGIYLEVLIWMLRHDLLRQLFTFIRIRVPTYIKEMVAEEQEKGNYYADLVGVSDISANSSSSPASHYYSRDASPNSVGSPALSRDGSHGINSKVFDDDGIVDFSENVSKLMRDITLAPAPVLSSAIERRRARRSRGSSIGADVTSILNGNKEINNSKGTHLAKSSFSQIPSTSNVVPLTGSRSVRSCERSNASQRSKSPSTSQSRARSRSRQRQAEREGGLGCGPESLIAEPEKATAIEQEWLAKIVSQKLKISPNAAAVFERIKPFFNGRHSVEEIIYLHGLRRRDMKEVLRVFKDELITVIHF